MRTSVAPSVALALGFLTIAVVPCAAAHNDALSVAARQGDLAQVQALLAAGADPNDYERAYSPLMHAAGAGNVELTRLLLARGAKVDHRDHNGERALLWAAYAGHVEIVRLLLAAGAAVQPADDPHRITPLLKASGYGHLAVVRELLQAGADPNWRDHVDDTALHGAALSRHDDLVALLLRAGADPRAKGKYLDQTPLHRAAERGTTAIVRLLIDAGADLEARDHKGRTALWSAAALDQAPVVDLLLAAGADPDARDGDGVSAFVAATRRSGATARLLVERTRDLDRGFAAAVWGRHADLAMRLAERGADVNAVDGLDRPALAGVALHEGAALLDWFLARGVDLDRHGASALLHAAGAGRVDLVRALLDAGVAVNARNRVGASALLQAAGSGRVEVVRLLLERGADRNARDAQGRNADDTMDAQSGLLTMRIKTREASRAYKPTGALKAELDALVAHHADIKALLAR